MRFNAAGQALTPVVGPFPASEAAFEDALLQLGGRWEEAEAQPVEVEASAEGRSRHGQSRRRSSTSEGFTPARGLS